MPVPVDVDECLPRRERFVRADYRRVFDEGKSFPSRYFVLWVLRLPSGNGSVGTVVSKKTFPLAVQRNRARRLMREAYRHMKGNVAPGCMLLMLGRRRIVDAGTSSGDVLKDFSIACRKAGIWRDGR